MFKIEKYHDSFRVCDTRQGFYQDNVIATCRTYELAERIVNMLEEKPGYY